MPCLKAERCFSGRQGRPPGLLASLVVVEGPDLSAGSVTFSEQHLLTRLALPHVQTQPGVIMLQLAGGAEGPPLVHVLVVARHHLQLDRVRGVFTAARVHLKVVLMINTRIKTISF